MTGIEQASLLGFLIAIYHRLWLISVGISSLEELVSSRLDVINENLKSEGKVDVMDLNKRLDNLQRMKFSPLASSKITRIK